MKKLKITFIIETINSSSQKKKKLYMYAFIRWVTSCPHPLITHVN